MLRGLKNFREIAAKAGVTNGQWHNWESGKNVPTLKSVRRIAPRLSVDPEWILLGEGRGPQPRTLEEPRVTEEAAPYGLDRTDQKLVEEIMELLRDADDEIKRDLRRHVKLLRRVPHAEKKRA